MSHSSFFQRDLFVFNVSSHKMMFYDVVRRQCDRSFVLCKGKNTYKNTRYVKIQDHITITSEVIKIVPSQLQRVNMSHSSFFQPDLFVFNVSSHNMMFYDVVRRQCDRSFVLCKGKNTYKNTRYVFYVLYQHWVLTCFMNIDAFELCSWYSEVQQLLVSIMMIFPSPEHILLRNAGMETF